MNMLYHKTLTDSRWNQFSFMEQMGNIGGEIGRMRRWKDKDRVQFESALERALELLDLTRADARWQSLPRLKELCRLRETLLDAVYGNRTYGNDLENLDNYLLQFAVGARLQK